MRSILIFIAGGICVIVIIAASVFFESYQPSAPPEAFPIQNAQKNTFFVFVGEQIDIEPISEIGKSEEATFYDHYEATYRIVEPIWGDYKEETIKFSASSHYQGPPFARNKYVMLFVSKKGEAWIQEINMHYNVYQTEDEKWAYCGAPTPDRTDGNPAKSYRINFSQLIYFDTQHFSERAALESFPEPIWLHENGIAKCVMGTYTDELLRVSQEGILKSRGLLF